MSAHASQAFSIAHCTDSEDLPFGPTTLRTKDRKVFRIGTVRYNWPMSSHASQAFSIAHCTDSEDLPQDISALDTSELVPNCLDISAQGRHFGTGQRWTKPWQGGWLRLRNYVN